MLLLTFYSEPRNLSILPSATADAGNDEVGTREAPGLKRAPDRSRTPARTGSAPNAGGYSATVQLSVAASLYTSLPSASSYTALTEMLACWPAW